MAKAILELEVPQPPKCGDYRYQLPNLAKLNNFFVNYCLCVCGMSKKLLHIAITKGDLPKWSWLVPTHMVMLFFIYYNTELL